MIVYGLGTCDTCRKALAALRAAGKPAELRDLRASPLSGAERDRFLAAFGPALVNRSSTTWRGLSEAERARPAADLLADYPALMKRPVIADRDGTGAERLWLGWGPEVRQAVLRAP